MATNDIYNAARDTINRVTDLTLGEKRKIREMSKVIDDNSRYNDIINRGGSFSLAEKEMLRKILDHEGSDNKGKSNDPKSRPASPTDYPTIRRKINRNPTLTNKEKKIWRDFFKDVRDNYVQFLPGEYFLQSGFAAIGHTTNPLLYGYVSETTQTELGWYDNAGQIGTKWVGSDGSYILTGSWTDLNAKIARYKYDGTTSLARVDDVAVTDTGSVSGGLTMNPEYMGATHGISFGNSNFGRVHSMLEVDKDTPAFTELATYTQASVRSYQAGMDFRVGSDANSPTHGNLYVLGSSASELPMIWELTAGDPPILTYKGTGAAYIEESHQQYGWDRDNYLIYDHTQNKLFTLDVDSYSIDAGSALTGLSAGSTWCSTFSNGFLVVAERDGGAGTMNVMRTYSLAGTVATLVDEIDLDDGSESVNAQMRTSPYTNFVYYHPTNQINKGGVYKVAEDGTITQLMLTNFYNGAGVLDNCFGFLGSTALPTL